ncbi:MAG: pantetheine-phosphate adenylyltransferase [Flavobacteriaceae bacterium]|nr:pantetheine-phosphate adenylyltransferase [Flavobacteriaceae bacterium]
MRKAVFPGTFDPLTIGHVAIVRRGLHIFDEVVVAIGINSSKTPMFRLDQRIEWVKKVFAEEPRVSVDCYDGLTIEFCKKLNATAVLRGTRNVADFDYEKSIAQINRSMQPEIETVFLVCDPAHSAINSTWVRDIIKNGGNASQFLPPEIVF